MADGSSWAQVKVRARKANSAPWVGALVHVRGFEANDVAGATQADAGVELTLDANGEAVV